MQNDEGTPAQRRHGLWAWLGAHRVNVVLPALLLVGALTGIWSLALFTSQAVIPNNNFTAGTVVLTTAPSTALITSATLMPGDSATSTLVVTNGGTAQLRYSMVSASTNADTKDLRSQMTLTIKTLGTSCAVFDGTSLYTGSLNTSLFGNPLAGAQAGDRVLAASTSETLCFKYGLPIATGNTYQGAVTSTTFTFDSEQTVNNP